MTDETPDRSSDESGNLQPTDDSRVYPGHRPNVAAKSSEDDNSTPVTTQQPPPDTASSELDVQKAETLLHKKGAVEILVLLADGPKQFTEINDTLTISRATVSDRLSAGGGLLWGEYISYTDDDDKVKLYQLSPEAEYLAELALEERIDETAESLRRAKRQHEHALASFRDRVSSESPDS